MPLNVFQEQVNATHNVGVLTPAKIIHQTREFKSTLRKERFQAMKVNISSINVIATVEGQEVDLSASDFEVILQLIPCSQTAIRDDKNKCKLKFYKELDLIKLIKKKVVVSIEKRGSLILRCIARDKDPKNPLSADLLKNFRINVQFNYEIVEEYSPMVNPRTETKAVNDLRESLNNALSQIASLRSRLTNRSADTVVTNE